ncbi:hypothetical protein GA0070606_2983 [Micromonospora citrea]|uniref:Uncharacterized protein n=1 Tax=Micromonospora citrea TaxID=47855 RepID=A0A1C6UXB3_9ACTN|nr:hypothetical protein [Micromonospora citrea]SCL58702.1 hypothetical protein GA0070606_2983 [Micromonospora citrea]
MYDRRDLVHAYLAAQGGRFGGYRPESSAYNAALKAHHTAMLDGLQQLFGLRLHADGGGSFTHRVLFRLFSATADSFLALRTPWSNFLEAGLLVRMVEEAGAEGERVMAASQRVDALTAESRETHLEMLDALVAVLLGDRAVLTFSPADLRAIGVDDTMPSPSDHPLYEG